MLDRPEFTKCMLEKLVWICAFMLVGTRHGGCTVGEVEAQVQARGGWGCGAACWAMRSLQNGRLVECRSVGWTAGGRQTCLVFASFAGAVLLQHKGEVGQLIDELAAAGSAALGVQLDGGVQERLCAYARSGASTEGGAAARRLCCLQNGAEMRASMPHFSFSLHASTPCPAVAHFPTAVKEFPWRNGYFHGLSQAAAAAGRPDPCPTHTAWLKEVGAI